MIKKYIILFFLATAYSVLLAHNFTPHQHEKTPATQHHDHDHNHDHEKNNESENELSLFHFFPHTGGQGIEYTTAQHTLTDTQKKETEKTLALLLRFLVDKFEDPPPIKPSPHTNDIASQQSTPYFIKLKAPPALVSA